MVVHMNVTLHHHFFSLHNLSDLLRSLVNVLPCLGVYCSQIFLSKGIGFSLLFFSCFCSNSSSLSSYNKRQLVKSGERRKTNYNYLFVFVSFLRKRWLWWCLL